MKVLSFAPYQNWDLHHQLDSALLRALRLRGAETAMVTCDGTLLAGVCYALTLKPGEWLQECQKCGKRGRSESEGSADRSIILGDFLTAEDYDEVETWMNTVDTSDPWHVFYKQWNIGEWVVGTVYTHIKSINSQSAAFRQMFLRYCRSGLLCAMAMDRVLDQERPDHMILFGARDSAYRTVYELGRAKGIRILYHERGYVDDSFVLVDNETIFDKAFKLTSPLPEWMAAPLSREQCMFTRNYLLLREDGRGMNWSAFLGKRKEPSSVWSQLGIPPGASICSLFTSTPYELEAFLGVPSSSQRLLMENIVRLFADRDQWLVIRVHPNTAGKTVETTDLETTQFFVDLQRQTPANVVVILPDEDFNSYTLLYVSSAVLAPYSSMAYEGAARGLPSAVMGSWMTLACVGKLDQMDIDSVRDVVDGLINVPVGDVEVLRRAYRFAYMLTSRICTPFASFGMRYVHSAEKRFGSDVDLQPGNDPTLDRVCSHILKGTPLYKPVPLLTTEEEDEFLAEESTRLKQDRKLLGEVIERKVAMQLGCRITLINLGGKRSGTRPIRHVEERFLGDQWRAELPLLLAEVKTPYVSFWRPGVEHLDRFHGSLLESLQQSETPPARGARHGVWVADERGVIRGEALSMRTRDQNQEQTVWQSYDAWSLLCLGVFRVAAFAEWLGLHGDDTPERFAVATREWLLSEDLLVTGRPMAVFHRNHA